ncbi:MAG: hypothetical protein Q9168_007789 [Polycauliona sp. 1 TL-2023]
MLQFFRTKGKVEDGIQKKVLELRRTSNVSTIATSAMEAPKRLRGRGPKIPVRNRSGKKPVVQQAAFCLPSCPVDEDMHRPGLYLHEGHISNSLSFLFGANNPPPNVKAAYERLIRGHASEEDEELILLFLSHHPFQPGVITDGIYFNKAKPELLTIKGNPLSFTDPEVVPMTFVPIRVAPIKAAG